MQESYNLSIGGKSLEALKGLSEKYDGNKSKAMRRSLVITKTLFDNMPENGHLIIKNENGEEKELVLVD